jgi:hypothetical protein
MKKYIERYKKWRHELRRKLAQRYADLIVYQLEGATDERIFNYWMNQGLSLDSRMIVMHDIYLD